MFYVGSLGSDLTNPERGVQKVFFVRLSRGSDWRELMGVHGGGVGLFILWGVEGVVLFILWGVERGGVGFPSIS